MWSRRLERPLLRPTPPWKGWRRLEWSSGGLSGDCWMIQTLPTHLLHTTVQSRIKDTMWRTLGYRRGLGTWRMSSSRGQLRWQRALVRQTGLQDGRRHYPSAEESEYMAELCFAIAAAASCGQCAWVMPSCMCRDHRPLAPRVYREHWLDLDHREHWLDLAPRALAICLGIRPVDTAKQPESPLGHVWRMCYSKAPSPRGMCMWAWGIMPTASPLRSGNPRGRLGLIARAIAMLRPVRAGDAMA
jgi:hypothetical protein